VIWTPLPDVRPLAIAHRGASGELLENTLEAIDRAIALGADGVEIDVQLSADGTVMVFHDPDLIRLAGRPERIAELAAADLKAIAISDPVDINRRPYTIPTLREVLELCQGRARVDVELKTDHPGLVDAVLADIRGADFADYAYLTSFNPHFLRSLAERAPDIWIGALIALEEQFPFVLEADYPGACIPLWLADEERVAQLRARDKSIVVWTVNNLDDIYRCIELGVDAVVTNHPDRVVQARMSESGPSEPELPRG